MPFVLPYSSACLDFENPLENPISLVRTRFRCGAHSLTASARALPVSTVSSTTGSHPCCHPEEASPSPSSKWPTAKTSRRAHNRALPPIGLLARNIRHLRLCSRTTRSSSGNGAATTERITSNSVSWNGSRLDVSRIRTMLRSLALAPSSEGVPRGGGRWRSNQSSCGIVIVPVPWSSTDHSSENASTACGFTAHLVTCRQSARALSLVRIVQWPSTAELSTSCLCSPGKNNCGQDDAIFSQ